jgi:hypothetical protein
MRAIRLAAGMVALAAASTAAAQATRTWVSGVGDDANPCSRTAPCKTFAGAISKTAAGGEIDALDPGEFGPLTVTGAITVRGAHSKAGILASTNGVTINAGAGDVVVLRDLDISGPVAIGSGIQFLSGRALHVEDCAVSGFAGDGVEFAPEAGGQLFVTGLRVGDSGNAAVRVLSGSATALAQATLARSALERSPIGLLVEGGGRVTAYDSLLAGHGDAGVAVRPAAGGDAEVNLEESALSADAVGVSAGGSGGSAVVRLSQVVALDESSAVIEVGAGGRVYTFQNNRVLGVVPSGLCLGVTCEATACQQAGSCDEATGACARPDKPDGTTCDDGNACTQADTCQAGVCAGASPVTCDGGSCDPSTGSCTATDGGDGGGGGGGGGGAAAGKGGGCGYQTGGEATALVLLLAVGVLRQLRRRAGG